MTQNLDTLQKMNTLPAEIRQRIYVRAMLHDLRVATTHRRLWRDVMNQLLLATFELRKWLWIYGNEDMPGVGIRRRCIGAIPNGRTCWSGGPEYPGVKLDPYRHFTEHEAQENGRNALFFRNWSVKACGDPLETIHAHGMFLHTGVY